MSQPGDKLRKKGNLPQLCPTAMTGPKLDLRCLTKTFGLESERTEKNLLPETNLCELSQKIVLERSTTKSRSNCSGSINLESLQSRPPRTKVHQRHRGGPAEFPRTSETTLLKTEILQKREKLFYPQGNRRSPEMVRLDPNFEKKNNNSGLEKIPKGDYNSQVLT